MIEEVQVVGTMQFIPYFMDIAEVMTPNETLVYGIVWFYRTIARNDLYKANTVVSRTSCVKAVKTLLQAGLIEEKDGVLSVSAKRTVVVKQEKNVRNKRKVVVPREWIEEHKKELVEYAKSKSSLVVESYALLEIDSMLNWLDSSGREYVDYSAFAKNWMLRWVKDNKQRWENGYKYKQDKKWQKQKEHDRQNYRPLWEQEFYKKYGLDD